MNQPALLARSVELMRQGFEKRITALEEAVPPDNTIELRKDLMKAINDLKGVVEQMHQSNEKLVAENQKLRQKLEWWK